MSVHEVLSDLIELVPPCERAIQHVRDSLAFSAQTHVLSQKMLSRIRSATGPLYAITGDRFDSSLLEDHDFSVAPPDGVDTGRRPKELLVSLVKE
jgi:hypothetical protein